MLFYSVKICFLTNNPVANTGLMTAVPVCATRGRRFIVLKIASCWDFIFQEEKYKWKKSGSCKQSQKFSGSDSSWYSGIALQPVREV